MAERKVYLYRLNVTLPQEAADPEWEPPGWASDPHNAGQGFQWPRVTRYLSRSRAEHRACLLRKYGAEVTIERSAPVTWPQDGLHALYEARADFRKIIIHAEAGWARGEYEKRQAATAD